MKRHGQLRELLPKSGTAPMRESRLNAVTASGISKMAGYLFILSIIN